MRKVIKARAIAIAVIMGLDFLAAPVGLHFLYLTAQSGAAVAAETVKAALAGNPFWGLSLIPAAHITGPWLWLQLPAVTVSLLITLGMFKKGGPGYQERSAFDIRSAGRGEHGTARWRSRRELKENLGGMDSPKGGFVCGVDKGRNFDAYIDTADTHCLLIGATRSGKSRRIIIPTIWILARKHENMVVTDPKGELYARCAAYLKGEGYKVVRIDLRDPYTGLRWNPLQPVSQAMARGDMDAASQLAWDLAHLVTHQRPHHGDAIWPQAQESLTAALVLATASPAVPRLKGKGGAALSPAGDRAHMASAYKLLSVYGAEDGEDLDLLLRNFPDGHPAKAAYGVAGLSSERLRSSIFTGTAAQLRLWAEPSVAWLNAEHETDPGLAGREKAAVFLVIPDERGARNVLAALYIAQCYQELADISIRNGGTLTRRVNFLLDEAGNIPAIPDFDKKLTVAGGRNIRFLLAVQSLAQVKAVYGQRESTITGNCAMWIYLSTADVDTARLLSVKTGRHTVRTANYSVQHRGGVGVSESTTGRELLMPDEVMRWPKGDALLLQTGRNPARLPLADFTEWPTGEKFEPADITERSDISKTVGLWELPEMLYVPQK